MTEEVKATTETETETTAKPEAEKTYKQADVDAITEKVRKTEGARVAKYEKELADLRAKNESEAEKAARELKESNDKAIAEAREGAKKQARLMGALQARGLTEAQAEWWADKAGSEWTTAEDAIKTLQEVAGLQLQNDKPRAPGGGGGRNTTGGDGGEWSEDRINAVIRRGEYAKYRPEIEKARQERLRKAGVPLT